MGPKTKAWLKGLGVAVIGGVANAGSIWLVAPEVLDQLGWEALLRVCVGSALIAMFGYLKKSPLPNGEATHGAA